MNNRFKAILILSFFLGCKVVLAGPSCQNGQLISQTFTNGSKWELCWEQKNKEGIVLKEIFFTTPDNLERKVLKEVSLAQIHVAFDDGSHRVFHLEDHGMGGDNLQDLANSQCTSGQLVTYNSKNVLCVNVAERGYVYKDYAAQKQGQLLDLYSQSHTDGYSWIVRWQFHDDGTIEPTIGATGSLHTFGTNTDFGDVVGTAGEVAVASSVNYFWRLDFDIAGNGSNDAVDEFIIIPSENGSEKSLTVTPLATETGQTLNQQMKRSWRIRDSSVTNTDGHPVSYHLEPFHAGYLYTGRSDEQWAQYNLYVTQYNVCERFIANNHNTEGCATNITEFLDGQNINGTDIVVWYGLSYHHFPRDEDQPYMPTRWDSFQLIPRDWTSTSPMVF